ncbi:MAG: Glycosyltransferase involved in cell wall bisynthesis [Candidatus Methanomarinus sp.]|nr:MAG: Glycosyltransferase involved in cell wall bisynthesis [ANME-2 cluster archaeon]
MDDHILRNDKNVIIHEPFTIKTKNWFLFYLLNFSIEIVEISRMIKKNNIDVVIAADLITGTAAVIAAKITHTRLVFDYLDDFPEMVSSYLGYYIKNVPGVIRKFAKFMSKFFLTINIKFSNATVGIGEQSINYAHKHTSTVYEIPNGVDMPLFDDFQRVVKRFDRKISIIYVGGIEFWVNLKDVVDAVTDLDDVELTVVGDGRDLIDLKKYVEKSLTNNVKFTDRVAFEEVPVYIKEADMCVLPFFKNTVTDFSSPLKIHEYAVSKKPIISTPLHEIKRNYGDAVLYASNADEFKEQIKKLIENPELGENLAESAYRIAKNFDWEKLGGAYEEILEKIVREGG